ncbi:MAG: Multidrug resistance protein MdtK [Planctomycetes bacterium ADurb.Bin401]|nr:MAG: Multidrug resistance protein MdtK [Planctomycetes bacterium ADurb.Bin401]
MKENTEKSNINEGGCKQVLKIAFPLILSTSAMTLQMFVDRVFLMWFDRDAMSGAMLGGILSFVPFSLFLGTATYASTFVSQYDGAKMPNRIGPAVWQSVYFSFAAGLIMACFALFDKNLIAMVGHEPQIAQYELVYFRIMILGSMPGILDSALSCFLTGRGKTWTVMWINLFKTLVNIVLDYALIFGHFGFPRWGVAGAAAATVIANISACAIYLIIFFLPSNRRDFFTSNYFFDKDLFGRLMKFGFPSGVQFMLDVLGFTLFVVFIGRIDPVSFAASSMVFQINMLAFMPMIGFGMATTILVGREIGAGKPELAQKATWSAAKLTFGYMITVAVSYWLFPDLYFLPFSAGADPQQMQALRPIAVVLLYFVSFYCIFDTGNIIFSAALKGAGDTRFVMYVSIWLNWLIMVIPSWAAITYLHGRARLFVAWAALSGYVCALAVLFLLRFLSGKWKSMRVIEKSPGMPPELPAMPAIESDIG